VELKLVHLPTLEGPGVENVVAWSVKVMNRKTIKTRTGAYHVTLPIRLVEEFDELLSFKASRSKAIAYLMRKHLDNDETDVGMMTDRQVIAALMARFEPNSFQYDLLYSMSQSISQKPDEPSS